MSSSVTTIASLSDSSPVNGGLGQLVTGVNNMSSVSYCWDFMDSFKEDAPDITQENSKMLHQPLYDKLLSLDDDLNISNPLEKTELTWYMYQKLDPGTSYVFCSTYTHTHTLCSC